MATAEVRNRIRSGPDYHVTLRDIEEPARGEKGSIAVFKLDFMPPKDIEEYPDLLQESSTGRSQMFLGFSIDEAQGFVRYLHKKGLFESDWFTRLMKGENV